LSLLNLYPKPDPKNTEFSLNGLKLSNEMRDILVRLGLEKPGMFDKEQDVKAYYMAGGKL